MPSRPRQDNLPRRKKLPTSMLVSNGDLGPTQRQVSGESFEEIRAELRSEPELRFKVLDDPWDLEARLDYWQKMKDTEEWTDLNILTARITEYGKITKAVHSCGFIDEIHLNHDDFMRIAKMLFRIHPVTKVVITDKTKGNEDSGFYCVDGYEKRLTVHQEIWSTLSRIFNTKMGRPGKHNSETLGKTCVLHGRELNGLMPIWWPGEEKT